MSNVHAIVLRGRGIVEVAGPDATAFLQGLVTNDVAKADATHAVYAALLTPQGKIIYDFLISPTEGGFFLDCVRAYAPDLAARLKKYKLRAKVTVTDRSDDLAVVASSGAVPGSIEDPRLAELGYRAIMSAADAESHARGQESEYRTRRLSLGVPDSGIDIPPETLFPLDCNFEELHGVDFAKGCYVGQELTARMKHRATARRRMLPVNATSELPPPGTTLKLGSSDIGELRGSIGTHGLALVRLDRLGNADEATADGLTIKIGRPSYPLVLSAGDDSQ